MDNEENVQNEQKSKKPNAIFGKTKNSGKKKQSWWDKLPLKVKLYIIGAGVSLLLLYIIIMLIISFLSFKFLDFSSENTGGGSITEETINENYEEFWSELCEEGEDGCSEEEIKAAKELKASQAKFYTKLELLSQKYEINAKQKYTILTTIFYDLSIDEFSEASGAFELDESDEIDENAGVKQVDGKAIYERESDTLKELIKQFNIYTAKCSYDETSYDLKDSENKVIVLGFIDKLLYAFGHRPNIIGFDEAEKSCVEEYAGSVTIKKTSNPSSELEAYYEYLRTTDYFDKKDHLKSHFHDYGNKHGLDPENIDSWPEEDIIKVRVSIIEDIKEIVDDYMSENNEYLTMGNSSSYWWPIGSDETTEVNGVLFATGAPANTTITSHFSLARQNPTSSEPDVRKHDGTDIAGDLGVTNVIAAMGGEVTKVYNGCASTNSISCAGGYGNHIFILDNKGNVNIYEHLYLDSIKVKQGDIVQQGQVLGKVGSSGNSTGPHLHFTIKINGEAVDPVNGYISAENPRPTGASSVPFNASAYTKEEFAAKLNTYYSNNSCTKSGCISFRNEVLNNKGADIIYDTALSYNVNPEIIIARIIMEGYSPGSSYNYFGYGCTNTGGAGACHTFSSFSDAMDEFFKNVSQYSSLESMMSKYAYIGKYWYTTFSASLGGCYYAEYIYPSAMPTRVQEACSKPANTCTSAGESACVPTTAEDQAAYASWQVDKMAKVIADVFGG